MNPRVDDIRRAANRLRELINEDSDRIPVGLEIAGSFDDTGRMMGAFVFRLQSSQVIVGFHDCREVFKRWEVILTDEFRAELWAVRLEAPAQLCGGLN